MLLDLLGQLGDLISEVESAPSEHGEAAEGQLNTAGGNVRVKMVLPAGFPYTLPRVEVIEEGVPACPPLMPDGVFCWQDSEDVLVDHANPVAVLRHCLVRVRSLLDTALEERPFEDIMSEYSVYWSQRAEGEFRYVACPSSDSPVALSFSSKPLPLLRPSHGSADGVLVPLQPGQLPLPPEGGLTVGWVRRNLLDLAAPATRKSLSRLLSSNGRRFRRAVFLIPRSHGLPLQIGVRFVGGRGRGHPLLKGSEKAPVHPFHARPWDVDFFRERGGADLTLKNKRVLVIGCGAVGGHIAVDLARSGVGLLMLVDPDEHTPENTFRHVLGIGLPHIGKAAQLAIHINASFPGAQAVPVPATVEATIKGGQLDLEAFDAAVVAVDRPAGAQALNAEAWSSISPPTVVHAWLEAYGLASHVLRTHPGTPGCFECLVRDLETGALDENRAHLAAHGQDFLKDQAGCGGRYVPFGAVHASRTAVLAVEQTLLGLGGDREPRLITWRGDPEPFLAAGYRLSDRGERWDEERTVDQVLASRLVNARCPVCGG